MMLKRRQLLRGTAALGLAAVTAPLLACQKQMAAGAAPNPPTPASNPNPLKPPAQGPIPVAFVLSKGAVMIDFAGPWEVFQDVVTPAGAAFQLYTVSASTAPIRVSGGMQIVPDYTFENAPPPKIIVIPAQNDAGDSYLAWIRKQSAQTDVTMSVCTGAYVLARTGLLSGKRATTFHMAFDNFEKQFPDIQLQRGLRFVEDGNLASAGGLSSGIDLALRVVERYFGRDAAEKTAFELEYQGQGWKDPKSNNAYAVAQALPPGHVRCPVCGMEVDAKTAPTSSYHDHLYYFCTPEDKKTFDAAPDSYATSLASPSSAK